MTRTESLIPVELLRELLSLDEETGTLMWKPREARHFTTTAGRTAKHKAANWNGHFAGTPALASPHVNGYLQGRIRAFGFLAHRVVWAIHYGEWPRASLDHINGVKTDNRLRNLRLAGHVENARNMKRLSTNSTGVTGVSRLKRNGKFYASIRLGGKTVNLGTYPTLEEAASARAAANAEHGFHPNHGRAA